MEESRMYNLDYFFFYLELFLLQFSYDFHTVHSSSALGIERRGRKKKREKNKGDEDEERIINFPILFHLS